MKKRYSTLMHFLLLVVTIGILMVVSPPKASAQPGCVTYHEFLVVPYQHKSLVERDWEVGPGRRDRDTTVGNPNWVAWTYPTCNPNDKVVVLYREKTWQAQGYLYFKADR